MFCPRRQSLTIVNRPTRLPILGATFRAAPVVCGAAIILLTAALGMNLSCRREAPRAGGNANAIADAGAEQAERRKLIFPPELHADDPAVNAFLEKALTVTAEGDYEEFRLLWAAADEPFARDQYLSGWRSVLEIRVELLQKMRDGPGGEVFYAVYARAELDPREVPAEAELRREVVLLVRREDEAWKLAHAPPPVREEVQRLLVARGIKPAENDNDNIERELKPPAPLKGE